MAINVYLSGATGAADGTLDVQGDGIGLSITALNSVAVAHLRAPSGDVNADAIVATAPTDCHASTDGVTYGTTATYAAGEVGDTNTPLYIKRIADSGNTEPLALTVAITGLTNTEAAPLEPAAPVLGTVTVSAVTASTATVTFSATDANDDPLTYKVAVTTSATPPSDWSGYSTTTSPYSATGLTGETDFYAHVLASDGVLTDVATSAEFTTLAAGDTEDPVIAGTLTAIPTATQGQVTLAGPTATDNVGIAKWQYQVDSGSWVDVASTSGTFPSTTVSGLSIGSHNFAVRAVDPSSNPSTTKTASATVADITAPTISGTLAATPGTEQITLSGPTASDNVAIAKWQYQVDGGAWVDVASTSGTFPSTVVSGLTAATLHSFAVRVVDTADNISAELTDSAWVLGSIYAQDFSGVTLNDSVLGYDGWDRNAGTLNNAYSTFKAVTYNSTRMVEVKGNASDPAPQRAYIARLVSIATPSPVKVSAKLATTLLSTDLTITGFGIFRITNSAFQIYRGSAYVDIVTGLASGAIHDVSIKASAASTTADIAVNGTTYPGVALNAAASSSITKLMVSYAGGTAASHFGAISVEAV